MAVWRQYSMLVITFFFVMMYFLNCYWFASIYKAINKAMKNYSPRKRPTADAKKVD